MKVRVRQPSGISISVSLPYTQYDYLAKLLFNFMFYHINLTLISSTAITFSHLPTLQELNKKKKKKFYFIKSII